jgi:hypothetical protein
MFCRQIVRHLALTFIFVRHMTYWLLGVNSLCPTRKVISFVGDDVVGWCSDECSLKIKINKTSWQWDLEQSFAWWDWILSSLIVLESHWGLVYSIVG